MAAMSFDELWGSNFHNTVSAEYRVQDIKFNNIILKKRNLWEK